MLIIFKTQFYSVFNCFILKLVFYIYIESKHDTFLTVCLYSLAYDDQLNFELLQSQHQQIVALNHLKKKKLKLNQYKI